MVNVVIYSLTEKRSICLRSIILSDYAESEEVSFRRNMYNFSDNYNAFNKCEILKIHKYLMIKNNIK